jgi:hypothetical protein
MGREGGAFPGALHMKYQFCAVFLLLCVWLLACPVGSSGLAPASPYHLQSVAGLEEGLCCKVRQGAPCYTFGAINCSAPLPHQCWCNSAGSECIVVEDWPMNHDICVLGELAASCSLGTTYCFSKRDGVCDDDGGAWSWTYLCTTCGCVVDDRINPSLHESRNVCVAGSTACP